MKVHTQVWCESKIKTFIIEDHTLPVHLWRKYSAVPVLCLQCDTHPHHAPCQTVLSLDSWNGDTVLCYRLHMRSRLGPPGLWLHRKQMVEAQNNPGQTTNSTLASVHWIIKIWTPKVIWDFVPMTLTMRINVFWDMVMRSALGTYHSFRGMYHLHLQGRKLQWSIGIYLIPEDSNLHQSNTFSMIGIIYIFHTSNTDIFKPWISLTPVLLFITVCAWYRSSRHRLLSTEIL